MQTNLQDRDGEMRPGDASHDRTQTVMTLLAIIRSAGGEDVSDAFSALQSMYEPLLTSMVRKYFALLSDGGEEVPDEELFELEEEARIALYHAAVHYDEGRHATFGLYAKICIRNALISYLRRHKRSRQDWREDVEQDLEDRAAGPEEHMISEESFRALYAKFRASLTVYETAVFRSYMQGRSYAEVARSLSQDGEVNVKSVENALTRIRKKLKLCLYMPE